MVGNKMLIISEKFKD